MTASPFTAAASSTTAIVAQNVSIKYTEWLVENLTPPVRLAYPSLLQGICRRWNPGAAVEYSQDIPLPRAPTELCFFDERPELNGFAHAAQVK